MHVVGFAPSRKALLKWPALVIAVYRQGGTDYEPRRYTRWRPRRLLGVRFIALGRCLQRPRQPAVEDKVQECVVCAVGARPGSSNGQSR
jgi:hypothetical protein